MNSQIPKDNTAPAVVSMLCGGSALAWMFWKNGSTMLTQWYIYPSIIAFTCISFYLFIETPPKISVLFWRVIKWWSGIWAILFILSFIVPPFSQLIIGSLLSSVLESSRVDPLLAGFAHLIMWTCALDILKTHSAAKST